MPRSPFETEPRSPAVETYLLGRIDFQRCEQLQRRLLHESALRDDGQITLLLCEHPDVITIGRGGSRGDLAIQSPILRDRRIAVHWVSRGGGSLVHCPGQLAIYPIIPLAWHGFSVGEFLERLTAGLIETLDTLGIEGRGRLGWGGIWGRTGQLAAVGAAVRSGVTHHGAFLNVCPRMGLFRLVDSDPLGHTSMSCLLAERRGDVRMTTVRATLVRHLTETFGCERYHLYTGHPLLRHDRHRTGESE